MGIRYNKYDFALKCTVNGFIIEIYAKGFYLYADDLALLVTHLLNLIICCIAWSKQP